MSWYCVKAHTQAINTCCIIEPVIVHCTVQCISIIWFFIYLLLYTQAIQHLLYFISISCIYLYRNVIYTNLKHCVLTVISILSIIIYPEYTSNQILVVLSISGNITVYVQILFPLYQMWRWSVYLFQFRYVTGLNLS